MKEHAPMLLLLKKKKSMTCYIQYTTLKDIQDSKGSPFNSLIDVSVVKNHTRTLSAQFQRHVLQIGLRRGFQNFATSEGASSKGDFLNKRMFTDSLPNGMAFMKKFNWLSAKLIRVKVKGMLITITVYDVDDTRRETSFVDKICEFECSQGRDLRRLANKNLNENDPISQFQA